MICKVNCNSTNTSDGLQARPKKKKKLVAHANRTVDNDKDCLFRSYSDNAWSTVHKWGGTIYVVRETFGMLLNLVYTTWRGLCHWELELIWILDTMAGGWHSCWICSWSLGGPDLLFWIQAALNTRCFPFRTVPSIPRWLRLSNPWKFLISSHSRAIGS